MATIEAESDSLTVGAALPGLRHVRAIQFCRFNWWPRAMAPNLDSEIDNGAGSSSCSVLARAIGFEAQCRAAERAHSVRMVARYTPLPRIGDRVAFLIARVRLAAASRYFVWSA